VQLCSASLSPVYVCVCVFRQGSVSMPTEQRERDAHYGTTSKTVEEHIRRGRNEQVFWGCRTHHYGVIFKDTNQGVMIHYRL